MKIKLSKAQWSSVGSKAGWLSKKAQEMTELPPAPNNVPTQPAAKPATGQQGEAQDRSTWTFDRLMQDPSFKQTFETIKKQKANQQKILQYWKSLGLNTSLPEIVELMN